MSKKSNIDISLDQSEFFEDNYNETLVLTQNVIDIANKNAEKKQGILLNIGYVFKKSIMTAKKLNNIKKKLTVSPKNASFKKDEIIYNIYKENDDYITIPRYVAKNYFKNIQIQHNIFGEEKYTPSINFKGSLRDKQINKTNICYNKIVEQGGGIISLPCGAGKTVISIYLACQLMKLPHMTNKKIFIIVNKTFLQNQWIERITQFTDGEIGIIRRDKVDIDGKNIIVCMLQSLCYRDYDLSVFNNAGCLIVDECHHIGSKIFSRALFTLGAEYTIGLSATPTRKDGLSKVFMWHLGDTLYTEEREVDNKVIVHKFNYSNDNKKLFKECKIWFNKKQVASTQTMITNICKIKSRNKFINNILNQLIFIPNRYNLVLSDRLVHLKRLKDNIDNNIKMLEESGVLDVGEYKTGYYVGGMKQKDLDYVAQNCDLIFATYNMAAEALDIERLNTLTFATGKKDIVQSLGRILRKVLQDGDNWPMVIDINDNLSCFSNWSNHRDKLYNKYGYKIVEHFAHGENVIDVPNYLLIKNIITQAQFDNPDTNIKEIYLKYLLGDDIFDNDDNFDEFYPDSLNQKLNEIFRDEQIRKNDDDCDIVVCDNIICDNVYDPDDDIFVIADKIH